MNQPKKIICTVTTDLNYDQRMIRICTSLAQAGYEVTLIGRKKKNSSTLLSKPYRQKRLSMWTQKGKLFYIEYNIRLFFSLFFISCDAICSVDLDSIVPGYLISRLRNKKRVYDAHELFCEMEEIIARPSIYRFWKWIERSTVPYYTNGYTVSESYSEQYQKMYGVQYKLVRNIAPLDNNPLPANSRNYILYQGAVNEGRCFEQLIPAMKQVDSQLIICGNGNFYNQVKSLISEYQLDHKIILTGNLTPENLLEYTQHALIGITLFTNTCLSNYYSLANRFFDYMQSEIPQLAMNFPEYRRINEQYPIAMLLDEPTVESISSALNHMIHDQDLYSRLLEGTRQCRHVYNWQAEEENLLSFWSSVFD